MTDVFLSYSRLQSGLAGELVAALREGGVSCWVDRLGIGPGERWRSALREGIAGSDNFLVLLDQGWLRSPVCREEYELACQYGKTLIPVVAEGVPEAGWKRLQLDVPAELASRNYIWRHGRPVAEVAHDVGAAVRTDYDRRSAAVVSVGGME